MLHRDYKVVKECRFTLSKAKADIPQLERPDDVVDVVMLTGVNDIKHTSANIPVNIEKMDATCRAYSERFPNATVHIGSVAPSCEKHVEFNCQLKKLASLRKVPFISTDAMFDRTTGRLRLNMVRGYHYTDVGLKTLAKEIKRSLRFRVPESQPQQPIPSPSSHNHLIDNIQLPARDARQEIHNFLNMAMSRLGNL